MNNLILEQKFLGDEVAGLAPWGRDSAAQGAFALGVRPQHDKAPTVRDSRPNGFASIGISLLQGWGYVSNRDPGLNALGCRISPPSGLTSRKRGQIE